MGHSLSEQIHKHYSELGAAIAQRLFGEGYLSPRGEDGVVQLARFAKLTKGTHVLDIGSGLGGAAFWLASEVGCSTTGLDLVASNVESASAAAVSRGVEHLVRFECGDATDMPFQSNAFSVVWGLDAWCHVPDRDALFAECARVLEPGGTIVFADWLLTGDDDDFYRNQILPAMSCPSYETRSGYLELLERHGFVDIESDDLSTDYANQYEQAMARLTDLKDWMTDAYGPRVYAIVVEKNDCVHAAFDKGQLGGGHFRARKPV